MSAAPSPEAIARSLFEQERDSVTTSPLRRPSATYRLQMNGSFRFDDLTAVVDLLADLGISDVYLSPYLQAKPGSTHGYDVFDHGKVNPEIGDDESHARLLGALEAQGLGRVLDIVPNHMGISGPNRFWLDVLECGPISPSARFFDIDWHPVKHELEDRVLLPILGDQFGKVLESGELKLGREGGSLFVSYYDTKLPLFPKSYARVLERRADDLQRDFDPNGAEVLEYRSIWASAHALPDRDELNVEGIEQTLREKEVIKRRIDRLCGESPAIRRFLDENIASFRGRPGEPATWDAMEALLNDQVYRLAYWRVASDEINYRRFFDINDLAGLRTENPIVFDDIHRLILRWNGDGGVTGLRVDHPDGLADPKGYFARLQEVIFLRACRARFEAGARDLDWAVVAEPLKVLYREAVAGAADSPVARRFPVVAEKILSRGEELPEDWPIDGTVGYEYLNVLNGLFIDTNAADSLNATYADFTGDREPFPEVLYEAKQLITRTALSSELNMLSRQLAQVAEGDRRSRDFTLNELRRALRDVIASFPVYRTYVLPDRPTTQRDAGYIEQAVARARRRNPTTDATVFEFIRDALMLQHPPGVTAAERARREAFVARFQQTTGPVQAKGLEDTSFYRQFPLLSRNEVGGDPSKFGNAPQVFHALNSDRLKRWPGSLGTSATHDTKRGEDTRIRINVLSEISEEWKLHLARWSQWNRRKKTAWEDGQAPDAREEYLLYQSLVGVWPFGGPDDAVPDGLVPRVQEYMLKAAREAKRNTSWTDTDSTYSDLLTKFVADVLEGPDKGPFLKDFLPFQRRIARVGVVHSLAQTLLKITSPGVPDIYQGCELWDFSLVDPDNRRPVDYEARRGLLGKIRGRITKGEHRGRMLNDLLARPEDGAIKLAVTHLALRERKAFPELYARGAYRPVEAEGELKANVVAFARTLAGRSALVVAPRLMAGRMGDDGSATVVGPAAWGDTRLVLPDVASGRSFRDVFTGESHAAQSSGDSTWLGLGRLFEHLPLALLVAESS